MNSEDEIQVTCPECGAMFNSIESDVIECPSCRHLITREERNDNPNRD